MIKKINKYFFDDVELIFSLFAKEKNMQKNIRITDLRFTKVMVQKNIMKI